MRARLSITLAAVALAAAALAVVPQHAASASPLTRAADPVVLTGSMLPTLVNGPKGTIVGFRWTGSAWTQIPIQIDERAVVNFGKIYNNPSATFYNSQPGLVNQLVYTSGATFTGNDPNRKFDADDELAFMARDSGVVAPGGSQPTGTVTGTGVQLRITDPNVAGAEGYVYLFRRAPGFTLPQGARQHYVRYRFKLLSGAYKKTYNTTAGPNLENSLVTGATYRHHFSDRWLSDQIQVTAPGSSGVDILDRHKALFAPGNCVRSEDTFDAAEGAFVVNKVGAVRAIRSYIGANSGPSTQRTHIFYDRREDVVTNLRVHAIPSVMDFLDYNAAASGMTYRNSLNPTGVTVDGNPDTVIAGVPSWEQITGTQGTITNVGRLVTTGFTPASVTSWYQDDTTPPYTECTSDSVAYGQSGMYIDSGIPNTDPALGGTATLVGTRTMYFDGPGGTSATAAAHQADTDNALVATASSWAP